MNLNKIVKPLLALVGVPAVLFVGDIGLYFYKHNNVKSEQEDGTMIYQKADGIFAHTELRDYKNGSGSISVSKYGRFLDEGYGCYEDWNGDGKVDWVLVLQGAQHWREFARDQHATQYPHIFQKADKNFKEQLERFKLYVIK